jgi:antitoxin component YwqK of YwqJK toxin-antitoxin module
MKQSIFCIFLVSLSMIACVKNKAPEIVHDSDTSAITIEIPDTIVNKSLLHYNNHNSLWTYNNRPYSGYAVSYHQDSTLREKLGFFNGKTETLAKLWYPTGNLKQIANYHNGKLHGEKKVWSSDSILLSHLNYQSGKPHGEQKTWYPTGELHKKLNLYQGKEEGIQQAYRTNGALYANYEAKEGRIFGLKKASLCYGLEDENIDYEK